MRKLLLIAPVFIALMVTTAAHAQQDITPPALLDVRFEPTVIDTSEGPATIEATVHVTDDLSGLVRGSLLFRKPDTTQSVEIGFSISGRVEGTSLNGIYQNTMTLPQYSAFGTWEMYFFTLVDNVGNRVDIWKPANEEDAQRGTEDWLPRYNDFVFVNGESEAPHQFERQLFMPSVVTN